MMKKRPYQIMSFSEEEYLVTEPHVVYSDPPYPNLSLKIEKAFNKAIV